MIYNRELTADEIQILSQLTQENTPSSAYYPTTGSNTYTSGVIDTGAANLSWGNISWTNSTGQTISMQARTAADLAMTGSTYGTATTNAAGTALSTLGAVVGHRYIQYKATLSTASSTQTPSLDSVTIGYSQYATSSYITSSAFNANDATNIFAKMQWAGSTPGTSAIKFQIATSSNNVAWSNFAGPDGLTSSYFTSATGAHTLSAGFQNAKWFKYKAYLTSDGSVTPILTSATSTYVVNAPPQFDATYGTNGIIVAQSSTTGATLGKIALTYKLRDVDGNTGSGVATPSFEYSTTSGATWAPIPSQYLGAGDLNNIAVDTTNYTTGSMTWDARNQLGAVYYSGTMRIRVTTYDGQLANATSTAISGAFSLDTQNPINAGLTFDAGVGGQVNSASITINRPTDNNPIEYLLSDGTSTAGWTSISATTTLPWTFDSVATAKSLKLQLRDNYGNVTASTTYSTAAPSDPNGFVIQDVSKIATGDYRLYIGWATSSDPTFVSYKLEYATSTDNSVFGAYSNAASISVAGTNYYVHTGLNSNLYYRYRLAIVNAAGNTSVRSSAYVNAKPDGVQNLGEGGGGSVATAAAITAISPSQSTANGTVTTSYTLTDTSVTSKTSPSYEGYVFYNSGVTVGAADATTITVSDASRMPMSGYVQINNEVIKYTSKTGNVLGGLTRGTWPTTGTARATRQNAALLTGTPVWIKAISTSPITIANSTIATGQSGTITWNTQSEATLAGSTYPNIGVRVLVHDNQAASSGPITTQSDQSTDGTLTMLDMSLPTVQFSTASASGADTARTATATVALSKVYPSNVTVNYTTTGSAASTNGLIGYWQFEGDASDASGSGNNGTWAGTSTNRYTGGKYGSSATFNGSSDRISANAGASATSTSNQSLEAWFKLGADGFSTNGYNSQPLVSAGNIRLYVRYDTNQPKVRVDGPTSEATGNNLGTGDRNWHHLVGTYEYNGGSTTTLKVYIDGALQGTTVSSVLPTVNFGNYIGTNGAGFFNGQLDNVATYNRVLSASEVANHYTSGIKDFQLLTDGISVAASDDFTNDGIYNASTNPSGKWTSNGTATKTFQNGVVSFSASSTTQHWSTLSNRTSLSGDFDIQVDYSNFVGPNYNGSFVLGAVAQTGGGQVRIGRRLASGANTIYAESDFGGTAFTSGTATYSDTSGTLRIQRIGLVVNTYYKRISDQGWTLLKSFAVTSASAIPTLILRYETGGNTTPISYDVDNFIAKSYPAHATTGTLTIPSGATSTSVTATILNDQLPGADRNFTLALSNPTNATLGANGTYTYTIQETDTTPTIGFSASASTTNGVASTISIPVVLNGASGQAATVNYAISGSAISGTHYSGLSNGVVTIPAGATSTNITFNLLNDAIAGPTTTTIVVTLSDPANATLGTDQYTLTISEPTADPAIAFTTTSASGLENVALITIPVSVSAPSARAITVGYSVSASSTAVSGTNYILANGTATIPAGATSTNLTATIINNPVRELDKTLVVTLASPSGATLGAVTSYTYTIQDIANTTAPAVSAIMPSQNISDGTVTIGYTITDTAITNKVTPSYEGYVFYSIGTTVSVADATTITVSDASRLPATGFIQINNEVIQYTSKAGNVLSGLTRGTWPTPSTTRSTRQNASILAGTLVWIQASSTKTIIANTSIATGQNDSIVWSTQNEPALAGATYANVGVRILVHDNQSTSAAPLSSQSDQSNDGLLATLDMSAPTVGFTMISASASETDSATTTTTIALSKQYPMTVSVDYAIDPSSTGIIGVNYAIASASGTLTIPAGATSTVLALAPLHDIAHDEDKTVIISLSNPTNASLVGNTFTYTISEADFNPTIGFAATSSTALETAGTTTAVLELSYVSTQDVSIQVSVDPSSTAVEGVDYALASTTVVIPAGSSSTPFEIALLHAPTYGADKTLTLNISAPVNAALASTTQFTLRITETDNATPEIGSVTATQVASSSDPNFGKVTILYAVRDANTNSGTVNPTFITPSFEYNTGLGWNTITTLAAGDTANKSVSEDVYAPYTAVWDIQTQLGSVVHPNVQVRVTANDNEPLNGIGQGVSATFGIDKQAPQVGQFKFDARTGTLTIAITDAHPLTYTVSNNADLSADGANATSGIATTVESGTLSITMPWTLSTDAYPAIHLTAQDSLGNVISNLITIPGKPRDFAFNDISDVKNAYFKELISWLPYVSTSSAPFASYDIYRSVDGSSFTLLATSATIDANFIIDTGLASSSSYTYKMTITDTYGNVSEYSDSLTDTPDGQGQTDLVAPSITDAPAVTARNTSATVIWTTDEIANSVVEYATLDAGDFAMIASSTGLVTDHSVTLLGLTPNTPYLFRVRSTDPSGNTSAYSTEDTFMTTGGPIISDVAASTGDRSVTITWNTNKDSNSVVSYSRSSNFSGSSEVIGTVASATGTFAHSVSITGLDSGTTYYYVVKSTDADQNESVDDNNGAGYSFQTLNDTSAPTISDINVPLSTPQSFVLFWKTDEPATSQVYYDQTSTSTFSDNTAIDTTLSVYHSVVIEALTPNTTYYYQVRSRDIFGNEAASTSTSVTTAKEGEVKIVTVGGAGQFNTPTETKDTTAPTISNITVATTTPFGATVTFTTSEPTIDFMEYGKTSSYGSTAGSQEYTQQHSITIDGLRMGTEYHFRVKAIDKAANSTISDDLTFKTKYVSQASSDLKTVEDIRQYEQEVEDTIESILPGVLPPFVETAGVTDITENSATIVWRTNIRTYGVVSYATEEEFTASSTAGTYPGQISDIDTKKTDHTLLVTGLIPNTKYHFKVKSFSLPQVVGEGKDLTFTTKAAKVSARVINVKNSSFNVVWSTDDAASTIVEYRNIKTGETQRKIDDAKVREHDMLVDRLLPATTYEVTVFGYNEKGNLIESGAPVTVSTARDISAPKITGFKVDGALVPGRTDRVQTVVTWSTDELSNSVVYYQEGAGQITKDFANKSEQLDTYTNNHAIILSNLKPGTIYQMKIESTDAAGNKAAFGPRTVITPQKGESIFDVIFKNFEDTFKFLRGAGQ